jgi:hypothetical protein
MSSIQHLILWAQKQQRLGAAPMPKADELEALKSFIDALPADSYLRPWLEQEAQGIQVAMESDMPLSEYCHGFNDLRVIQRQLDERAKGLNALGLKLHDERRVLSEKASAIRSFVGIMRERLTKEFQQQAQLLSLWHDDLSKLEKDTKPS